MTLRNLPIVSLVFVAALSPEPALPDVVILKSGKELQVEKVWQENGRVWVVIDGMRASIKPSSVKRIASDSSAGSQNDAAEKKAQAPSNQVNPKTAKPVPRPESKKVSQRPAAPKPANLNKDHRRIFPDEKFGDLKWGIRASVIKGLEKISAGGGSDDIVEYLAVSKNLTLGKIPLKSIQYAFWRDQLYMLTFWTEGHSNYTALRDEVFRQFGQGRRDAQAFEKFRWTETPDDMMLEYSKEAQQSTLWLRSAEIDRQYKLSRLKRQASYLKWIKSRN